MRSVCPHTNFDIMFLLHVQRQETKQAIYRVSFLIIVEITKTLCSNTKVSVRV